MLVELPVSCQMELRKIMVDTSEMEESVLASPNQKEDQTRISDD